MLKLSHLVDDKIHARSIGPYSLVTQQPLAGKAQFGGQRFGKWKCGRSRHTGPPHAPGNSDGQVRRRERPQSRVRGDREGTEPAEPGIPESFNVLVKELQALGIRVAWVRQVMATAGRSTRTPRRRGINHD